VHLGSSQISLAAEILGEPSSLFFFLLPLAWSSTCGG
jgi:hypothetical protein